MNRNQNLADSLTDAIRQHGEVIRGHDHVHPDRNDCGGVGGCALMRAEHDAETRVINRLEQFARTTGVKVTIRVDSVVRGAA